MPEQPPLKRRPPPRPVPAASCSGAPYAELHAKTNFSFLEGASHPDELVTQAAALGYRALAITDRHSLAGVVRAHVAAKELELKLLIGAEIRPEDACGVVLLATDRASYGRLARLLTLGKRRAPKGECRLTFDRLAEHAEGLLACVLQEKDEGRTGRKTKRKDGPGSPSASQEEPDTSIRLHQGPKTLWAYRELFGDRCYALAELHYGCDDRKKLARRIDEARRAGVPPVAANDVRYHAPARRALEDVLTAVRAGTTVAEAGELLFANAERYLKSREELADLFAGASDCLNRTIEVADRCVFSLDELRYEYPEELCPAGLTPLEYLIELAWQGANNRYPGGVPDKVRSLIEHELALIAELRYEAYFLTVWDLVRFARSRQILCQGRGSAANSAVCYCLGVTAVDPERMDVLFERFISRERNEAPDIDVDFEHERREEVIQYVYDKYGRDRAGMTAEVITYRFRSAVRDVGKALGFSLPEVDRLAKLLDAHGQQRSLGERSRQAGLDPASPDVRRLLALVNELVGFPRHLSQHVGGMVMTRGPLSELVPIENAAMPGRTVIEWDKDDLDELGILKVDCLALGMLTAIRRCFAFVEKHHGRSLTLANIRQEDQAVYEMICRADTMGVFQIESRAQMSMLPRLRPRTFYDLVIEVAIVRPGPIQGNMVHPYLRRRNGEEEVRFPSDKIRRVLEKTLGVPIFQEQAMRLAVVAAGFTPGEADQLRRAMGGWRRPGLIEQFRQKLHDGMVQRGLSKEYAERVFEQIRGFGEYGFPESHSASFALLVYVSAWLKHYYPDAFAAALLNSQPMGFYAPAQLVRDAREHGVEVRPVEVNHSDWDCTLEGVEDPAGAVLTGSQRRPRRWNTPTAPQRTFGPECDADSALNSSIGHGTNDSLTWASAGQSLQALRLGFRQLRGMPEKQALAIMAARAKKPFRSVEDFARRTGLGRPMIVRLAKADAFSSFDVDRRGALWHALEQHRDRPMPLFDRLPAGESEPRPHDLPALAPLEEVVADYRTAGLSLKGHPMGFLRKQLDELKVTPAVGLARTPHGCWLRVAGLVLVRQRPGTASGITFVTLEDETGIANLIVRPAIWERYRREAATATALLAHGRLERQGAVIHVLVSKLEDVVALTRRLGTQSRDFR
ncbi:MAG TPA: error-prone DNA polymerase [Pirellulales bacterium]|nr:error-prone DNA polymerase [Pirellulales bacterium]